MPVRLLNRLWKQAAGDRALYRALLREYGFIYEREDGVTVHTEKNPKP